MLYSEEIIKAFTSRRYEFFTGVPCSLLKPLIISVVKNQSLKYVAATSEGEATAIASGAFLSGKKAVVMCQNSGLGNAVNPITSLNFPFRIPILFLITLRGEPNLKDEPQHELMGLITEKLLDTIQIKWKYIPKKFEELDQTLKKAEKEMNSSGLPFALILKKGTIEDENSELLSPLKKRKYASLSGKQLICKFSHRMARIEAIEIIREACSNNDAIIATTGKIGRELFSLGDEINQFYVVGSMGYSAGLGLGIQLARPKQRVVVLDGDGAVLMKMGTLATIGHYRPNRLIHIILDNETYESTGGQYTLSSTVSFSQIASACGYKHSQRVDIKNGLKKHIHISLSNPGPTLIHVKVKSGSDPNLGRPLVKPSQVRERFRRFLTE